jgi:diguanylate cyclase (GGDEF)-like protein
MHFLTWFDNRTLVLCLCVLTTVFTALMLGLRSFYPAIAGIVPVTAGFVLGTVSMLMMITEGTAPLAFSILGGGTVLLIANIVFYRGVLAFVRSQDAPVRSRYLDVPAGLPPVAPDRSIILYVVAVVACAALAYCTQVRVVPAVCLLALTLPMAIGRGIIAMTFFQAARGRRHILWLAATTGFFALIAAFRSTTLLFLTTPMDVMHEDHTQTLALLLSVLLVAIQGVFYVILFAGEVATTIEREANVDQVCGILNRRGIEDALEAEMARARRGGPLALLLIDIDHFKQVNDRLGHAAGDRALRQTAQSLSKAVRVYDVLGRFGGDEFLVLLPETGPEQAMLAADRIRRGTEEDAHRPGALALTLSMGATCFAPGDDPIQFVSRADAALYQAKRDGRDRARIFLAHGEPLSEHEVACVCAGPLPREA